VAKYQTFDEYIKGENIIRYIDHFKRCWNFSTKAAEEKFNSALRQPTKQSTCASQIADSIEAACFPVKGEFILPRKSWLMEWCRQLRTLQ